VTAARLPNIHACRRYVRSLQLDLYASAYELCDQMSSLRDRPIRVIEWPLPIPGPMGVWIARERDDVVVVQEAATGSHRDHIVLHELAHILCEHEGIPLRGQEPGFLSEFDDQAEGAAPVRFRSAYDSASEREAELLATALAERLSDDSVAAGAKGDVHRYFSGE
jgi:Zn-dependent peptidase ImmA (M78 family)